MSETTIETPTKKKKSGGRPSTLRLLLNNHAGNRWTRRAGVRLYYRAGCSLVATGQPRCDRACQSLAAPFR